MSPGVTHRAAASSHRDAGISCRSVNLARGAQEGKVIPPGSLQHPASQGARGTLAVLPAVGTGRGRDGSHRGDWGGRDLKDHPGQPPVPHFSLDAGCGHCTKPAGRAGGAAPHASKPREMPRAAFLRVSSMERIRNKMQTEQVSQSLPPLVCTESWSCLETGVSAGLLVSLAVSNPCQKIGIFSAVVGTAASDLLTPYPAASEMF